MELKYFIYIYLILGFIFGFFNPIYKEYIKDFLTLSSPKENINKEKKIFSKIILFPLQVIIILLIIGFYLCFYPIIIKKLIVKNRRHKIYTDNYKREKEIREKENTFIKAKYEGFEMPYLQIINVKNLPFDITTKQVIYFEDEYNPFLNEYFKKNYEKINQIFKYKQVDSKYKFDFIYIPNIIKDIDNYFPNIREKLNYYYPHLTVKDFDVFLKSLGTAQTKFFTKTILNSLGYTGEFYSGFFRYRDGYEFGYFKIDCNDENELEKLLWYYYDNIQDVHVSYQFDLSGGKRKFKKNKDFADLSFETEANKIAKEIKDKIALLKSEGYYQLIINTIAQAIQDKDEFIQTDQDKNTYYNLKKSIEQPKLSSIIITKDFKIFLPDFNNLEIELTPLPKAIFLLFLRHPEGLVFKYLVDYKSELLEIYKQLSYRETEKEIKKSIEELVNPTNNSINEKCSRIKEAFVKNFDDSIAKFYYVTGDRGKEKSIKIDRNLVIWEL